MQALVKSRRSVRIIKITKIIKIRLRVISSRIGRDNAL
jgi:hypothetical protein